MRRDVKHSHHHNSNSTMVIMWDEGCFNSPYCGKYFTIYTYITSPHCTPETYTLLQLYHSKAGKKENMISEVSHICINLSFPVVFPPGLSDLALVNLVELDLFGKSKRLSLYFAHEMFVDKGLRFLCSVFSSCLFLLRNSASFKMGHFNEVIGVRAFLFS